MNVRGRFPYGWHGPAAVFVAGVLVAGVAAAQGTGVDVRDGGIVRGPRDERRIALEFTGHEFAEGGDAILDALARRRAKASFFLTGVFLRNPDFAGLVRRLVADGHYLGPHSDKHLLYCSWAAGRKTLVTREALRLDLDGNLRAIERFGVGRADVRHFVPAYEWYNSEIAAWSADLGLQLVNFTPGTRSNADYTGEADPNFVASETIVTSIFEKERTDPDGLNGFLLLLHVGAGPGRRDKMHDRLGDLLDRLIEKGYTFVRVDELLRARR
jgi:peptidoglycan/xylan/chitin deacetylase (PgdA/CDA1 family)